MFGIDDIISSALAYQGVQDTNASREKIASEANAFSAQQYATRYQTQVKDMQAAGLNPMLSYMQSPGSAPTGQQAQIENPMGSAIDAYNQSKQRDLLAAQVRKVDAEAKVSDEQAKLIAQQVIESKSKERQADTSANESTIRMYKDLDSGIKTQRQLGDLYWSQMKVNEKTLPKIASEIVRNGADAAQARAIAYKAIQEGNLSKADLTRALNEKAFEESALGRSRRFVEYGLNSAGKIVEIAKSVRPKIVRENGTYYDSRGVPSGGYSRSSTSK